MLPPGTSALSLSRYCLQCTLYNLQCTVNKTCLSARLESLAWSQQGFRQTSFWSKHNLWSLCCNVRNKIGFLCIACIEKIKKWRQVHSSAFQASTYSLSSRKAMKRSTTLFPLSKQRHNKSQFLQKLSCQKPYWDQATLSGLQVFSKALGLKIF